MITCKKCKFWERNKGTGNHIGKCSCNNFVDNSRGEIMNLNFEKKDFLLYSDFESYQADFETMENFGCIHGVKK